MTTTNLQFIDVDPTQLQKATTSNTRATQIDTKITEQTSVTVTTANITLTDTQHNRTHYFKFTGAMTGNRDVICKTRKGLWVLEHACTGGFTITFKPSGGTGVNIINGQRKTVYCDGTNVIDAVTPAATIDASAVTYTPAVNANWDSSADPGNGDDALDQLADRIKTLEGSAGATDASAATYTPAVASDWNGSADPGNVDDALDQLAARIATLGG